jgi:hypothetical protein
MWKDGVNPAAMDTISSEISQMTQALDQGNLGNWPVVSLAGDGLKLVWGVRQLLGVVESRLAVLEQMVAEQESKVTGAP